MTYESSASSVLWQGQPTGCSPTKASTTNNSSGSPSRSDNVNGRRYSNSNAQVPLNPDGKPVAYHRVRVLQAGTFAGASRLQLVTPRKTASISRTCFGAYKAECHPLNQPRRPGPGLGRGLPFASAPHRQEVGQWANPTSPVP